MTPDMNLEEAILVCAVNNRAAVPIETLDALVDFIDLCEAALEGISSLEPLFEGLLQGHTFDRQTFSRNLEATRQLKQFYLVKKPQYQAVRESVIELKQMLTN